MPKHLSKTKERFFKMKNNLIKLTTETTKSADKVNTVSEELKMLVPNAVKFIKHYSNNPFSENEMEYLLSLFSLTI
jgi:hypothetical protein